MGVYLNPGNKSFSMAADMLCAYYDKQADSRELFQIRLLAENVSEVSKLCKEYGRDYKAIKEWYDGLKEAVALLMAGGHIKININKYQNDMTTFTSKDDILALLIHLGYLAYSDEEKQAYIPNKEVAKVFEESTESSDWFDKCWFRREK